MSVNIEETEAEKRMTIAQSFSATRGVIEKIHVPQRDKYHLNFPCFQTSARYDGGMSGGPILGKNGNVIGVVCSSFGAGDDGKHTSYGSLIAPALAIPVEATVEGEVKMLCLDDFVISGAVIADESYSIIQINKNDDSVNIEFNTNCP